jgi:hypothetical protein
MSKSRTELLSLKIKINLTKSQIFDAATDWDKQDEWVYLTKVSAPDNTPNKVGKKIEAFTGLLGIGFLDTMTIEEWDYPNKCVVVHTGNIVKGKGIFEASTHNNSNYFVWTEEVILPFGLFGRIGWIFIKPFIACCLWLSLQKFKKHAEGK